MQSKVLGPSFFLWGSGRRTLVKHPTLLNSLSLVHALSKFHMRLSDFLIGYSILNMTSWEYNLPHRFRGAPELISITFIIFLSVLFFLSATPLDSGEYRGVVSWIIPCYSQNSLNCLISYSPPLSDLNLLIFLFS